MRASRLCTRCYATGTSTTPPMLLKIRYAPLLLYFLRTIYISSQNFYPSSLSFNWDLNRFHAIFPCTQSTPTSLTSTTAKISKLPCKPKTPPGSPSSAPSSLKPSMPQRPPLPSKPTCNCSPSCANRPQLPKLPRPNSLMLGDKTSQIRKKHR